jgi:hypothetical protein
MFPASFFFGYGSPDCASRSLRREAAGNLCVNRVKGNAAFYFEVAMSEATKTLCLQSDPESAHYAGPRVWFVPATRNPRSCPKFQPLLGYPGPTVWGDSKPSYGTEPPNAIGNERRWNNDMRPWRHTRPRTWRPQRFACCAMLDYRVLGSWSASDHALLGAGGGRSCRQRACRRPALPGASGDL